MNHPGKTREVDAERYHVVREALLAVLPEGRRGMTLARGDEGCLGDEPGDAAPP